jgi:hypothetical protein
MKSFFKVNAFLLLFMAAGIFSSSAQDSIPGEGLIRSGELINTVKILSDPSMDGRQPGSAGYLRAAEYMRKQFESLGLKPAGQDGYYQQVPSEYVDINEAPLLQLMDGNKVLQSWTAGEDFVCRGLSGFGDVTADVVFCGYGLSEPQAGYDDYAGVDVKGKIVMVFKQNPSWKLNGVDMSQKYNRYRANVAAKHGALGLLLVSLPATPNVQQPIGSLMDGEGTYDIAMPQMHINTELAELLMTGSGKNLKQQQLRIDSLKQPQSLVLKSRVHMVIRGEYHPEVTSPNVVGMLEGRDASLKTQYVVVSAHLDHVGRQGPDLVFPGANDNASGSAAVLQMAKAFVNSGLRPARSVIFVLYTGEEQGLIGSAYFAEHCPVETQQIVAAINLDCIGHGDSIQVGGGKDFPVLWGLAAAADSAHAKLMVKNTWGGGGADLDALYKRKVPGIYFASRYSYTYLHLPTDKVETLNPRLYQELVKTAYRVLVRVAEGGYQREAD